MAFSFAIFCVPKACTIVTIEPSASGIAATASATANISASSSCICRYNPSANTIIEIMIISIASFFENLSRLSLSGVFLSFERFIRSAIRPISVSIPVAVTTTSALPYVTRLPEYTIFILSASAVFSSSTHLLFSIFTDSPVSELSFTCSE